MFRIVHKGNRRYFPTLDLAKQAAERIFRRTGNIVGIEETKKRKPRQNA